MARIRLRGVTLAYRTNIVASDLDLDLPEGKITALVGPNGSGKSTILKAATRILEVSRGTILLDGADIHRLKTKEVARRLAVLPQSPLAPEGITVRELVGYGRTPHQGRFQRLTPDDHRHVAEALEVTALSAHSERQVDSLSGGERQRAWIAMAVAQAAETVVLDEPTTYLDLEHQIGVLELLLRLKRREGRTIVLAVHDLNLAAQFADHVVVVRAGCVVRQGPPPDVLTPSLLAAVFHVHADVSRSERTGRTTIIPYAIAADFASELDGPAAHGSLTP